jgi:hypothetical protein
MATEGPNMNGNRYYGVRVEGAKYGLWFSPRYRDILHCQPLNIFGNHPRHFGLAVCDLLRAVSVMIKVRYSRRVTGISVGAVILGSPVMTQPSLTSGGAPV